MRNLNMTQGHPGRLLMWFALPLMAGNVFQQLYTVVDTIIVGRGVGMTALAALGTVDWLNWMFLGIAQGFAQGFSVRLAQKYGQGDMQGLKRVLGSSTVLSVIVALIALLLAQLGLETFLLLLRVPVDLKPQAMLYSRVILLGIPAMVFYNYTAAVLRAVGDSRTPLIAMAVASLSNIALDCVAVFWLDWGIAGAAAATVLAQILAGGMCTIRIARTDVLQFQMSHMAWDGQQNRDLVGLGFPVAAQNIIISVGGMALQTVVNGFDTAFIAGFTATNKLYGILEIAAVSYGYAVTTYTGQNYGAMQILRIRRGMKWAVGISLVTSAVIGGMMILFGRQITMLFLTSERPELLAKAGETAYNYLVVMAVCLPVLYLLHAYRSALQGMGNTRIPLLSGVMEFVMRVGGALIIGAIGWQHGIFFAEVLAWAAASGLLAGAYYRSAARFRKN